MNNQKHALLQLFADGEAGTGAAPAAEGQTGASSPAVAARENTDEEFEKLTAKGGKYADAFNKKVQRGFNERYKSFSEMKEKAARLEKFRDTIAADYAGVDASDLDALEDAYLSDARRFSEKAMETGKSAEDLAREDRMSRKLKQYEEREKRDRAARAKEAEAKRFYDALVLEEQEMGKRYADFSLNAELENPAFRTLVKGGASLEDAYFAIHRKELMQKAVGDAKSATLAAVAAKGTRPAEAASSAESAPAPAKVDYTKLSRKDFMRIWNE